MQPSGMIKVIGRRQPSLRGMSSFTRQRSTYIVADLEIALGALKEWSPSRPVPVKSNTALPEGSIVTVSAIGVPSSM